MTQTLNYGPRLVANPTGALRSAVLVVPPRSIENARPLPGEPNAIHSRAKLQIEILAKTLRQFDCDVTLLEPHTADPYASAVADAAVVFENGAVMMRPSSMTRRPESAWLEHEFAARDIPIAGHLAAPGLLDGSDVLMAGNTAFIGVSSRSNSLGRTGFAQIAKAHGFRTVEVALEAGSPPLRSVAGAISSDTLVLAGGHVDLAAFDGFKTIVVERNEGLGAGVLNIGEHHVLADVRFPRAIAAMRKAGAIVEAIDLYDFSRIGVTPSVLAVDLKRA